MPDVEREIHIDAPPAIVRRHVADPEWRRRWLDDDRADEVTSDKGGVVYPTPDGEVRIDVHPDGEGSRVRVTERVAAPTDIATLRVVGIETSGTVALAA